MAIIVFSIAEKEDDNRDDFFHHVLSLCQFANLSATIRAHAAKRNR